MADTNTYDLFQKVEKWTTKDNFNKLDPRTIATGTEYNLTGGIEESELASNLQTKINGKLTKPTNPSAESAVTMLADGTVGTKLLSEIGGGGKLYCHDVLLEREGSVDTIYVSIINNTSDNITMDYIKRYLAQTKAVCFSGEGGDGVVSMLYDNDLVKYFIKGLAYNPIDSSHTININVGDVFYISSQTLTEL